MSIVNKSQWDGFLARHPESHILQTSEWGEFKSEFGWEPVWLISGDSGAQVLFRRLPFGYSIAYVPKGPVGKEWKELLDEINCQCKSKNAIVLYIEPDQWENEMSDSLLLKQGFRISKISIQPRRTISISLNGSEEDWLLRMKQKTRYNIRLAEKKDVKVKSSSEIDVFNQLMKVTGERDNFGVHNDQYYQSVFNHFSKSGQCELLVSFYYNQPLAGLIVFFRGSRAWYFYGASNNKERNRMPTYLIQFEAMRLASKRGCVEYDLWGVPDFELNDLEEKFMEKDKGLWGVYRFKRGFGGELKRTAGVFQRIMNPALYRLYQFAYQVKKQSLA